MNMEYWIGVVQVVNGISFFGMLFGFGAAGISMLITFESPSNIKNNVKLYRLAAIATLVGIIFALLLIFVPSAAAVKAMYM